MWNLRSINLTIRPIIKIKFVTWGALAERSLDLLVAGSNPGGGTLLTRNNLVSRHYSGHLSLSSFGVDKLVSSGGSLAFG